MVESAASVVNVNVNAKSFKEAGFCKCKLYKKTN